MKSSYLRAGALACALALAGCGGGGEDLLLGGTVVGLTKDGLVLQNNGGDDLVVPANAPNFYFPKYIASDSHYEVTVKSSPSNAVCTVINGKGNSGAFNITSVVINCVTTTHKLGGTVTGLNGATGLTIVNGSDRKDIVPLTDPAAAVPFQLSPVAEEAPYGITILNQPAGRTCTIPNGVGKMGTSDINNIQVTCA